MAESKLETINKAIINLKALGLEIPYSLLREKENEEKKLFISRIDSFVDDLEAYARKQFAGVKDKVIDVDLIFNCNTESLKTNRTITGYEEFKKKRDAIPFYKQIIVYKEGYFIRELNFSAFNDTHLNSYVNVGRFESYDDEYLVLVTTNYSIFGITKKALIKQPMNLLVRLPQLVNCHILDAVVCKEDSIIEFVIDSNVFSYTTKSIKEIFGQKLETHSICGPIKLNLEHIDFIRIL